MITLTQLGLGGSGSSLGDTIYRHGEGVLITRDDGSEFVRSGTLIPFKSEYESSRVAVPHLFQKNTKPITLVHSGDLWSSQQYINGLHFFYASNKYFAVSQSGQLALISVSSKLSGPYTSVNGSSASLIDFVQLGNTIVLSGNVMDGSNPAVKLAYINTTNNTYVTAAAVGVNVPMGLLAGNGNAAVFRGISNVGGGIYSNDANCYYTTNGTTWTASTSTSNTFNPMVWFWSPAAGKYILASRSQTFITDSVTFSNVLDEDGNPIPISYLSIFVSPLGHDDWWLGSMKPGTGGSPGVNTDLANLLYQYPNSVSTSDAFKYPSMAPYIYSTPWQSLYANSPTVSLFSPGLYQAIARTTTGQDTQIIDLSSYLNDPEPVMKRITLAWDGTNFLAFYESTILYSPDGLTWTRTPHHIYSTASGYLGTPVATTSLSTVSVVNNRLVTSIYGTYSNTRNFRCAAEFTNRYQANTIPDTAGTPTLNYIGSTTIAYSYSRIK